MDIATDLDLTGDAAKEDMVTGFCRPLIFSIANQIVWRPGTKGGEVVAVGAPDEWLSLSPRVLPADAVHTDLVAEAFAATPRIDELWEAFFCYCIEVSRRRVGFWRWFGRQFFSPLKVDLRIRDDVKKEFVGGVLRRCKLLGPVDVFTTKGNYRG